MAGSWFNRLISASSASWVVSALIRIVRESMPVSFLSFHVVIVYVYPVLISCLYFSRRLTWIATALTASFVTIGQFASFFNQYVVDENFDTIRKLIVFGIIPRALVLVALACVLGTMTNSTSRLLAEQQAAMQKILTHQQDMITGFALLAENRDEVSGKHVQRVSMYTEVLARAMQKRGLYPKVLTDDYIECLISSTKLHDIGRISVSDAVLQKPGKLTESEFELVKLHTTKGGEIISQTLRRWHMRLQCIITSVGTDADTRRSFGRR